MQRLLYPAILVIVFLAAARSLPAATDDLDTRLMLATVKLTNPESTAGGFILSRPAPKNSKMTQYILVTAGHVFRGMKGEEATVVYRQPDAGGGYTKLPIKIKIRQGEKPLWTKHPQADVTVLYLSPPAKAAVPSVPVDLLASDADLLKYEIHPGDQLKCIGFPHRFEANDAGFGVLRTGSIAGFPLLPTMKTKTFLADVNTFEGDSGSPVYLTETSRFYAGKVQPGRVQLILGLMSGQHFIDEDIKMLYESRKVKHRLGLGVVEHATFIREAIDLLPKRE